MQQHLRDQHGDGDVRHVVYALSDGSQRHGHVQRHDLRNRLQLRLSPVRWRVREKLRREFLRHGLHRVHSTDGGHRDLRRNAMRGRVPGYSEALRGCLHRRYHPLPGCLPHREPRVRQPLRERHQRDVVWRGVRSVPDRLEGRPDVRRDDLRHRLQHRLPPLWRLLRQQYRYELLWGDLVHQLPWRPQRLRDVQWHELRHCVQQRISPL